MAVAASSENSTRFGSIDAVRGAAMLFVFLSHFTAGYNWAPHVLERAGYLQALGMVASPTFVLVSGIVVGFLNTTRPQYFDELRVKLFDRGVFLLVCAHLLMTLTQGPTRTTFAHAYRSSIITDAIAVAIIIGPSTLTLLSGASRLALAAAVFFVDWWAIVNWHPTGDALTAKAYLVGVVHPTVLSGYAVFSVFPWLAVYLAGSVLGQRVGRMYMRGERKEAHYLVARIGATSFVLAALVHGVAMAIRRAEHGQWDMSTLTMVSIYGKFPPGPVYVAFFGGAGLMMLAIIFEIDRHRKLAYPLNLLRRIGRSSLFVFTVQYAFYRSVLPRLGLPYTPFWPLIFIASVIMLTKLAAVWDRHSANRFLTVGITALWQQRRYRAERRATTPIAPTLTAQTAVGARTLDT